MSGLYFQTFEDEVVLGCVEIVPGRKCSLSDSPVLGHHRLQVPGRDAPVEGSVAPSRSQHQVLVRSQEGDAGEPPGGGAGHLVQGGRHLPIGGEVETPAGQQDAAVAGHCHHLAGLLHHQTGHAALLDEGDEAEVSVRLTSAGVAAVVDHPEVELHLVLPADLAQSQCEASEPRLALREVTEDQRELWESDMECVDKLC